jgi:hypothetical protein
MAGSNWAGWKPAALQKAEVRSDGWLWDGCNWSEARWNGARSTALGR